MGHARRNLPKVFLIGADFSTRLFEATSHTVVVAPSFGAMCCDGIAPLKIMFDLSCSKEIGDLLSNMIVPRDRLEEEDQIQKRGCRLLEVGGGEEASRMAHKEQPRFGRHE